MRDAFHISHSTIGCAVLLAIGLCACSPAASPASAHTATPAARTTPRATRSATPRTTATAGGMSVTLTLPRYAPSDTISVSIRNDLAAPIFARNENSDCGVVALELWVNGSWQFQAPCVNMQPSPRIIMLDPGSVFTQQLMPGQSDFSSAVWLTGTYRIAFAYVLSTSQSFGQSTVVYSASFVVG